MLINVRKIFGKINTDNSSSRRKLGGNWEIPEKPLMENEGHELLNLRLNDCKIYLEYGAGGSTVLAANSNIKAIYSVDSDSNFLKAVEEKIKEMESSVLVNTFYINIGPTKEWGVPTDPLFAIAWPMYCITPWKYFQNQSDKPDLILIDGRFRVASFLASLLFSKHGAKILFDDYFNRPQYHLVEKHVKPINRAGRMAEFLVEDKLKTSLIMLDLIEKSLDFD